MPDKTWKDRINDQFVEARHRKDAEKTEGLVPDLGEASPLPEPRPWGDWSAAGSEVMKDNDNRARGQQSGMPVEQIGQQNENSANLEKENSDELEIEWDTEVAEDNYKPFAQEIDRER